MITFNPAPDRACVDRHSPLIRAACALLAPANDDRNLALTRTGRLSRAEIARVAPDLLPAARPGARAASERDVPPLRALRELILALDLARTHRRRLCPTRAGADLADSPDRAFALIVPPFLFGVRHMWEPASPPPGDWRLFLAVLDGQGAAGITAHDFSKALYGITDCDLAAPLHANVLCPLGWVGMLTPHARDPWHVFERTPLWHEALCRDPAHAKDNVVPLR